MKIVTTLWENNTPVTSVKTAQFMEDTEGEENRIVNLYPEVKFQRILGFGGAFTESASYVFSRMGKENQKKIIEDYFGDSGLQYNFGRVPIDSCDFSFGNYSAVTDPDDTELKSFSLKRDEQYILPMIKSAQEKTGRQLKLVLSPWSPPAFMKTNGQKNGGGRLKEICRKGWADYICKYISDYQNRGLKVFAVTVQNEPKAVQRWDSCIYSSLEEQVFVRDFLAPALQKNGLKDVKIIIWDHNKERAFDRTESICSDETTNNIVAGVGFHWYSGDHFEALSLIRKKYPDKLLLFTEGCVEYCKFNSDGQLKNAQMYAHDMIGNFNAGMNIFIDWNLLLDSKGGPNHANNFCDAPILCDYENDVYEKKLTYIYISHFSKFVKPGAVLIGYTRYTDAVEVAAFQNPDEKLIAVLLNRKDTSIFMNLRLKDRICPVNLPGQSIVTVEIK